MRKKMLFAFLLLCLMAMEILRVYFIMPFPGSQQSNTLEIAYALNKHIIWLRILLVLAASFLLLRIFRRSSMFQRVLYCIGILFWLTITYFFNFRFLADKMFYQPGTVRFAHGADNKIGGDKLVLGIVVNGIAKAYPIQLIGYHHQVVDRIGDMDIMVTYCTVCRTGRVFQPLVNGKKETFRLVGMDHFNAMFEDAGTKSWWRQVSGRAVAGPLKGSALPEVPSRQMTLSAWLAQYPGSTVLQPDETFRKQYDQLAEYDAGTLSSSLEKRDNGSWKPKSFVVGVVKNQFAKAYDWNDLLRLRMIQDSLPGLPLLLTLENDKATFHSFHRTINGVVHQFYLADNKEGIVDKETGSQWNLQGVCISGALKGIRLETVQSYQEFWHSWQTFQPGTEKWIR